METEQRISEKVLVDILIAITIFSGIMSIAGGTIILYTYKTMPDIRNSTRQLLLFLTIADMGTAVGYIAGAIRYAIVYPSHFNRTIIPTDIACEMQSFVSSFSSTSSFIWTSLIAINLFSILIMGKDIYKLSHLTGLGFHMVGWIVPGIILITAAAKNVLGEDPSLASGPWCWITDDLPDTERKTWMFATLKGWELTAYLLTAVLYILLKFFTFRKRRTDSSIKWNYINGNLRDEDEIFCISWMVLYLVRVWGTAAFFIAITSENTGLLKYLSYQILLSFHCYGDCAQAFWNCVLYCFCDKTVRRHLCQRRRQGENAPLLNPSQNE